MSLKLRLGIVLALSLVGAALSGVLLQQHHGAGEAAEALCGETGSGCDAVNRSSWSELAGVPLAAAGLLFYVSLLSLGVTALLAEEEPRRGLAALALGLLAFALIVDLVLVGAQALAIGAWCVLCVTTYALNAGAFALLWPERRALGAAKALPDAPGGRLALGAWGLATVVASLLAASLSLAFATAGELREATLLGAPAAPTPRPTPQPAVSAEPGASAADADATEAAEVEDAAPAGEAAAGDPDAEVARLREELRVARAEAQRLKETLDDPQKLQQYRSDQAVDAYEHAHEVRLDLSTAPSKGPAQAPIRVVTFSDFLCPYCRNLAGALAGYLPQSAGRVALFYKHYPLDPACNDAIQGAGHPGSCQLALGGVCAEKMGAFWSYHDRVFSEPPQNPGPNDVADLAFASGLDRAAFLACLGDPATRRQLEADIAEGQKVGVHGTPTVFINGKLLERIGDFVRIVDLEAERLGLAPTPAPGGN